MQENPLLSEFNTPFDTAPFDQIELSHYQPAMDVAIEEARAEITAIKQNKDEASFQNTIEALERSGERLGIISSIFFNLNSAETSPEMQALAQEISPVLTAFSNDIMLDQELYDRIMQANENTDTASLSPEQKTLLEQTVKRFTRNGAGLDEEKKKQLRAIDEELSKLSLQFGQNVLAETNAYELHLRDESEVEGLPEHAKEAAAELAKTKDKEGYIITLQYPSYVPFMTYAKRRDSREKLYKAFTSRGNTDNETNNQHIVRRIARLRHDRASILGYSSHASYVLENRMAESPQKVLEFLDELSEHARPAAEREMQSLQEFANGLDGLEQLERWDTAYYTEKLKEQKFQISDEQTKPYFELDKTVKGMFSVANRLYGLNFIPRDDIAVYHKEVKTYEVQDESGRHIAVFYADFFPREGKRDGAWMTSYRSQGKAPNGEDMRPHISIVCNFTRPTKSTPSLLSFREVTTLFHEFGHALHGMLSEVTYKGLSGTSVYWDFVELPSQLMENWTYEKACLDLFATHYKTGEPIPAEMVDKLRESANFMEGTATLRQLSFGLLDMTWHNGIPDGDDNLEAFEAKAVEKVDLLPRVAGSCISTAFSHIFQGGYSSGYYSYKWAEVLDADAFEHFKQAGIFDRKVADAFKKHVLSAGGSEHPMTLYKRFRGAEPSIEPLLKRAGLLQK